MQYSEIEGGMLSLVPNDGFECLALVLLSRSVAERRLVSTKKQSLPEFNPPKFCAICQVLKSLIVLLADSLTLGIVA